MVEREGVRCQLYCGKGLTWIYEVYRKAEYDFSEEKLRDSVGFNFSQIQAFKLDEKWEEEKSDVSTG